MAAEEFLGGNTAFSTVSDSTHISIGDLQATMNALRNSSDPLEGKFVGRGRAAWDNFHQNMEVFSAVVGHILQKINNSQGELNRVFNQGDVEQEENATRSMGSAAMDDRFGA